MIAIDQRISRTYSTPGDWIKKVAPSETAYLYALRAMKENKMVTYEATDPMSEIAKFYDAVRRKNLEQKTKSTIDVIGIASVIEEINLRRKSREN